MNMSNVLELSKFLCICMYGKAIGTHPCVSNFEMYKMAYMY